MAESEDRSTAETDLLARARTGDEAAYRRLVDRYRAPLHAHCYRMLGSVEDADEALQDALFGAWQGLARFEGRSSLRRWLFTITTHACLRLGARRSRRVTPIDFGPPSSPLDPIPSPVDRATWMEPYPDDVIGLDRGLASPAAKLEERESIELAFVAALQHLPASQRAALILCDVIGFSAAEAAETLETSVAAVQSAIQRARATVEARRPATTQEAVRRAMGEASHRALVARFVQAWTDRDVDAIVAMLAEDAVFTMPPLPMWFRGREHIGAFFANRVFALEWRFVATSASNQPAIAGYGWVAERVRFEMDVLNVIDLREGRVAALTSFLLGPERGARFGLPASIPA
jgi:RNA polymerase sigma-70 factor, ECF subfamily